MTGYTSALWLTLPATEADAADIHALTREGFDAYADLQPQPSSLRESVEDVARELRDHGGLVVREGSAADEDAPGRLLAVARFSERDGGLWLRRVAVRPDVRRGGLASALALAAEDVARERGYSELRVSVRTPLRQVVDFWRRRGFRQAAEPSRTTRPPWSRSSRATSSTDSRREDGCGCRSAYAPKPSRVSA